MRRPANKFQQNIVPKQTVLAPATPKQSQHQTPMQTPKQVPIQTQVEEEENNEIQFVDKKAEDIKMEVEERKEDINLEDEIQAHDEEEQKKVNLDDSKKSKGKKEYDLDDMVLRDISLAGDIHVRLISNTNGYFIDLRKYFKGYPTKKGIRILASKFVTASELLKKDLADYLPK